MHLHLLLLLLFCSAPLEALAGSWHYNDNAGFGIYVPEGWNARMDGRRSVITGPTNDWQQSSIEIGSDWRFQVKSLEDLRDELERETSLSPRYSPVSGLEGFRVGSEIEGAVRILRIPKNVIIIDFFLRGSTAQIEEGQLALTSIEIRTRGIESRRHAPALP